MTDQEKIQSLAEAFEQAYVSPDGMIRVTDEARKSIAETLRRYARDAVPVIHCTECKYVGPSEYAGYWHCENWGVESNALTAKPETFYCADAERKEP